MTAPLIVFFGLVAAFGAWLAINSKTGEQFTMGTALAFIGGIVLLVMLMMMVPAHARDDGRYAQSTLKPWFDSLKSGKGPCCSDADGTALSDVDWKSKDGHYSVRIDDKWWIVPDEAVITQPNLVGRTMVWPIIYRNGSAIDHVEIRCFMPGPMI